MIASSYNAHIFFSSGSVIFNESITELPFAEAAVVEFVADTASEPDELDLLLHETAIIAIPASTKRLSFNIVFMCWNCKVDQYVNFNNSVAGDKLLNAVTGIRGIVPATALIGR